MHRPSPRKWSRHYPRGGRRHSPSFTVDEALGLIASYEALLLGDLLQAALDGAHLQVVYDSIRSGLSERVIYPFGLCASTGHWYCACFDHMRITNVSMRAGRFLAAKRVEGFERPAHVLLERWSHGMGDANEEWIRLRARVTRREG